MAQNYFLNRRSCRNFKEGKIDSKLIEDIVTQAIKAPTCGNMQLYTIITTSDKERLRKLSTMHYDQPAAKTSPLILTICADFNRFTRWCTINNAEPGFNNLHSFLTAMTDGIIVAQQIVTIAEMKGLGSCYLGTVTYNAKEIANFLKLPKLVIPVASVALGYPNSECERTKRLPVSSVLHNEFYRNFTEQEIQDIYSVHDKDADNEKFIKENKKENLSQVFADVRYPKSLNESASENFISILKEKDFLKK